MAHSNIYTKFLIEYDKANITSSYPSLTEYEVATILDRAYDAIIALKITGNNPRRSGFEEDIKAIEDIRPLITSKVLYDAIHSDFISNEYVYSIPTDEFMYYVSGVVSLRKKPSSIDKQNHTIQQVRLVSHEDAANFMATSTNMPWIDHPVIYIDGDKIHLLVDSYEHYTSPGSMSFKLTFIKKPKKFAIGDGITDSSYDFGSTEFELSDTVAEELISLAVLMATEVVESPRLNSKINTRSLEA